MDTEHVRTVAAHPPNEPRTRRARATATGTAALGPPCSPSRVPSRDGWTEKEEPHSARDRANTVVRGPIGDVWAVRRKGVRQCQGAAALRSSFRRDGSAFATVRNLEAQHESESQRSVQRGYGRTR